jgi:hypothetical protein
MLQHVECVATLPVFTTTDYNTTGRLKTIEANHGPVAVIVSISSLFCHSEHSLHIYMFP